MFKSPSVLSAASLASLAWTVCRDAIASLPSASAGFLGFDRKTEEEEFKDRLKERATERFLRHLGHHWIT